MKQSPLNAIQLLWVNLIMDSLAALALATEKPKQSLLERDPQNRNDYLVSRKMVKHVMYQSIWQSIILCILAFWGEYIIYEPHAAFRYDRAESSSTIYPGRHHDWDGKTLYAQYESYDFVRAEKTEAACNAVGLRRGRTVTAMLQVVPLAISLSSSPSSCFCSRST